MNPRPTKDWRIPQYWLACIAACAVLIFLFYIEENWRGQRAWENCKRSLKTQGVDLNWNDYVPAPVPDNENVFGVPEMQKWFVGGGIASGWGDLVGKMPALPYANVSIDNNTARILVAEVAIGLPGTPAPDASVVLRWDDPASRTKAARLITNAIGPTAKAPQSLIGIGLMVRRPEEIHAARFFLQCQTAPTQKDLQEFLPDAILPGNAGLPERVLRLESDGNGSYRITMPVLATANDYLTWSDRLEPQFEVVRRALQRPSSRMQGFYGNPQTVPSPNSRAVRLLVQILGARAQCHLLLGQPEEALSDLTLIHDFCRRTLDEDKPMTLLAAMIDVAVRRLYVEQIAGGLRLNAWGDQQLAVLEAQLKTIDVLSPAKQAFALQAVVTCRTLEIVPSAGLVKRSALSTLCPRGWGYQSMASRVRLDFDRLADLDAANQSIFPDEVDASNKRARALENGPYTFVASLGSSDFSRACQNAAHVQTGVNQALIACALERYRLAHGKYPENLDTLVPEFLDKIPHDVIGSQPPRYRGAVDDAFILYSIGWNGLDNGGVREKSVPGGDGDWVWSD